MRGDEGTGIFVFRGEADSTCDDRDTIGDFEVNTDKIDLPGITSSTMTFLAEPVFLGGAEASVYFVGDDDDGWVMIDVDGDALVDMRIRMFDVNAFKNAGGTILGNASMDDGDDFLRTTGIIDGDVDMGPGADTFIVRGGDVTGTIHGGRADDLFRVDRADLTFGESTTGGTDTLQGRVSIELPQNVEVLQLIGVADIDGAGTGDADAIRGNTGDNVLRGQAGGDALYGDCGDDILRGNQVDDRLEGQDDDDLLFGGGGDDRVFGALGDDVLIGGRGRDYMVGDDGAGLFVSRGAQGSPVDSPDTIRCFETLEAKIDLTELSQESFIFSATPNYVGSGHANLCVVQSGTTRRVYFDIDGDGTGDMRIHVTDANGLTEADFFLLRSGGAAEGIFTGACCACEMRRGAGVGALRLQGRDARMIDPDYCQTMARYNRWQNHQLLGFLEALSDEELDRDRGAFFLSIRRTVNHLLWADGTWMSRFDGGDKPAGGIAESVSIQPDLASWALARSQMDDRIEDWCEAIDAVTLNSDLTWFSGAIEAEVTKPLALCVVHFFNHQTHHRGQIHAMLTQTGLKAPVTDLFIMPD